jgi:hypothetical protein
VRGVVQVHAADARKFATKRNLVLEGLTDHWYVEATSALLADAGEARINEKVALDTASAASKVVYFATLLHANGLKVAALLDSDAAGDKAAEQDTLVHALGQKAILRAKDYAGAAIAKAEIEDLLRDTLVGIAKADFGWDVEAKATAQPGRPLVNILTKEAKGFSKYKLAKAYVRWTRDHEASDLTDAERGRWKRLIEAVNAALQ